ncbi:unnamed protein product [Coregonus sp. 'balchen']|nr:unnamed protein product [Coregonus sp. 'balchen']
MQVSPYYSIKYMPNEPHRTGKDHDHQVKQKTGNDEGCPHGNSWRSYTGPHRVFVPHSPLDLQTGHRVRVLLPSGRISTGTVRYLGHLEGEPDFHMGVELESPEHGQQDGTQSGQCYFECKPGHGAFVPFTKLLMAWE